MSTFQSRGRLQLLDDVDQFRAHGFDNLPQLVLCGEKGAKLSALYALSGISFLIGTDASATFATAISFRSSSQQGVVGAASILPHKTASATHREKMLDFKREIRNAEGIPTIIEQAGEAMRVPDNGICEDILLLRLEGQRLPNITIIDLPGLDQSSEMPDRAREARSLTRAYLEKEQNIILVVVCAEKSVESQEVLTLAGAVDLAGTRTVGIIIMTGVVSECLIKENGGDPIPGIANLANNRHQIFRLPRPWHVIRCVSAAGKDTGENGVTPEQEFVLKTPKNLLKGTLWGVDRLRTTLCQYLEENLVRGLSTLSATLQNSLNPTKRALEDLGEVRGTMEERRRYLLRLSQDYGWLTEAALTGSYQASSFFEPGDPHKRLRAMVMTEADKFETSMRSRGHTYQICAPSQSTPVKFDFNNPHHVSKSDIMIKVDQLLKTHRGLELPLLFNSDVVVTLFQEQSTNWPRITAQYTTAVCGAIRAFLNRAVCYICPAKSDTSALLLQHVFEAALQDYQQNLGRKIDELLTTIKQPFVYSTRSRLESSLKRIEYEDAQNGLMLSAPSKFPIVTNLDPTVQVLQCSRAYYSVAMENFIDNVVILGVENCLMSQVRQMFSAATVAAMDEDQLLLLVTETEDVIKEREHLRMQVQHIERSLQACSKHLVREFGFEYDQLDLGTRLKFRATLSSQTSDHPAKPSANPTRVRSAVPLFRPDENQQDNAIPSAEKHTLFQFGPSTPVGTNGAGSFFSSKQLSPPMKHQRSSSHPALHQRKSLLAEASEALSCTEVPSTLTASAAPTTGHSGSTTEGAIIRISRPEPMLTVPLFGKSSPWAETTMPGVKASTDLTWPKGPKVPSSTAILNSVDFLGEKRSDAAASEPNNMTSSNSNPNSNAPVFLSLPPLHNPGTFSPPFTPSRLFATVGGSSESAIYQSINVMPIYARHSVEELRLADYGAGRRFGRRGR